MKAAVLYAARQPFEICEVGIDKPGPREVLVRVAASGLCHSDYHVISGDLPLPLPAVLGHEVAGLVEAIGSQVTCLAVGDHVVGCALGFCGNCNMCVSGRTHLCSAKPNRGPNDPPRLSQEGRAVGQMASLGGFAEQILVHENALVKVDRALPLDRAALFGCGVLTGLGAVFNSAKVTPCSKVAVIGCGGVGLNVIQGARIAGASQIIAVDIVAEKRELARQFGATHVVDGRSDAVKAVHDISNGGVEFAFEVIGLPKTIEQAVQMLAPAGLMTIVGATPVSASINLPSFNILVNEWRVQGTYLGSSPFTRDIPRYAALYLQGALEMDKLISSRIPLERIDEGFATMRAGVQARNVIIFPDVMSEAAARA